MVHLGLTRFKPSLLVPQKEKDTAGLLLSDRDHGPSFLLLHTQTCTPMYREHICLYICDYSINKEFLFVLHFMLCFTMAALMPPSAIEYLQFWDFASADVDVYDAHRSRLSV